MTGLVKLSDFAKGSEEPILEERGSRLALQEMKLKQVVFIVIEWEFCNYISFGEKIYFIPQSP